jgi:ATP/maltotriose-dependent transcriptional regulator MalT
VNARESFSVSFSLSDVSETNHFVARQKELAEMDEILGSGDGMRRTIVLHGLGGIGKTQLTVAYAKLHRAKYSAIFWLNIKDEDSLKQSFARVARRILREHPSASRLDVVAEDSKLDEIVDAVKRWLDHPKNTKWLLVYDNYDNPKLAGNPDHAAVDIRRFLPEAYHGSIIITTRSAQVSVGHRIRLGKLENEQHSLRILSNASRRGGVMDGESSLLLADADAELTLQTLLPRSLSKNWTGFRWPWPRPARILTRCRQVSRTTCVYTRHRG